MTKKQELLLNELYDLLPENTAEFYKNAVNFITDLGYMPQKQKVSVFTLSFRHKNGPAMAKIAIHPDEVKFRIKFYACKDVPEWCIKALWTEDYEDEQAGRFQGNKRKPLDDIPPPPGVVMKKCIGSCKTCGGMKYYYKFHDREIYHCSAYPVLIPNADEINMDELKHVISEQHRYFLSLMQ